MAERGKVALTPNGIKLMLKCRGKAAGFGHVHAHRWRHNFAHEWHKAGGNTGDLMLLLGWSAEDMPRHYGASAAAHGGRPLRDGPGRQGGAGRAGRDVPPAGRARIPRQR